ncbi:MAG TPA: caspase family protein [Polyangia bacterium]|nr:caspase family protein [Polyangia bacterium]
MTRSTTSACGFALLLALGLPGPAVAAPAEGPRLHRYALLIGVADGGPSRPVLRYASSDARSMGRVLENMGGVAPPDAIFVSEPTRAAVDAGFAAIEARLRAEQASGVRRELLIYYSGHSDEDGLLLGRDRYAYDELRARVQRAPADLRVVILDSCASGAFTRHKGGIKRPPFLLDSSIDMRGHAFLTSTSADEQAQESDRIAASFFTYYLVSGLRGAADVNQDRRVTLQEAYQFAAQETLARTERTQSGPQHAAYEFDLTGTGDMVVTDVRGTQSGLVLAPELSGRIIVRQKDGTLIAELHKAAGSTLELGVEPGEYVVAMEGAPTVVQTELALAAGQHTAIRPSLFHAGPPREMTVARGGGPAAAEPAPPTLEAAAPALAPPKPLKLILFPTASDGEVDVDGFSFGFIADRVRRLHGFQLSLAYAQVDQSMRGWQLSVGANLAGGPYHGAQLATGLNLATGGGHGLQLSAGANVLYGDGGGAQVTAGVNAAIAGAFRGAQVSAGLNVADRLRGAQLTGGLNLAREVNGAQIGPINIAEDARGAQIGVINGAGRAEGARIGVVNVAKEVHGFQLGVINVASRQEDGESLALINLIGNGIHEATVFATDVLAANVAVKFGGRHLYTMLGVGYQPGDDLAAGSTQFTRGTRRQGLEAGFGWRFSVEKGPLAYLELEADQVTVTTGWSQTNNPPFVSSLGLHAGIRLVKDLTLLAGAGVNVGVGTSGQDADLSLLPQSVQRSGETTVRVYPGLLLGLQI